MRDSTIAICLGVTVTLLLHLLAGDLYINLLDEGIYLEGAARLAAGEAVYRDFFALTGPGTYWLVGAMFRLFGVSLSVARWIPMAGLGVLTACVFFLTARFTSRAYAAVVTFCYFGLMVVSTDMMVVNHRLDSAALAVLAVTLSVAGRPFAAGAAAAAAAWVTPPMLLLTAAIFALRRSAPYAAGVAACSAPAAMWLIATGALGPMAHHLLWSASNYSGANHAPYGSIVGGWAALFDDASGADLAFRIVFVGYCLMLPALVPVVTLAASALRRWHDPQQWFLALCGAAILASSYPRPNITNLRYLCAVFVVLTASLLYRAPRYLIPIPVLLSATLVFTAVRNCTSTERLGGVRAKASDAAAWRPWLTAVPRGSTAFAFPYRPIAVFLASGRNTTRYSYLQPGMMTDADEQAALADLERNPPEWVHHTAIPPSAYLRIWPASDPARLRMLRIEAFLEQRYLPVESYTENGLPVKILKLNASTSAQRTAATPHRSPAR